MLLARSPRSGLRRLDLFGARAPPRDAGPPAGDDAGKLQHVHGRRCGSDIAVGRCPVPQLRNPGGRTDRPPDHAAPIPCRRRPPGSPVRGDLAVSSRVSAGGAHQLRGAVADFGPVHVCGALSGQDLHRRLRTLRPSLDVFTALADDLSPVGAPAHAWDRSLAESRPADASRRLRIRRGDPLGDPLAGRDAKSDGYLDGSQRQSRSRAKGSPRRAGDRCAICSSCAARRSSRRGS